MKHRKPALALFAIIVMVVAGQYDAKINKDEACYVEEMAYLTDTTIIAE